jgi:hypothetical protein
VIATVFTEGFGRWWPVSRHIGDADVPSRERTGERAEEARRSSDSPEGWRGILRRYAEFAGPM